MSQHEPEEAPPVVDVSSPTLSSTESLGDFVTYSARRRSTLTTEDRQRLLSFQDSWSKGNFNANSPNQRQQTGHQQRSSVRERVSSFVQNVSSPHDLQLSHAKNARDGIAIVFGSLVVLAYLLINLGDRAYDAPIAWDLPTCVTAVLVLAGTSRLSEASTYGERVLLGAVSFIIFFVSTVVMFAVTSPCTHCLYMSASNAVESPSNFPMDKWNVWNILLSPDDNDDDMTVACRMCVSDLTTLFIFGGWNGYISKRLVGISSKNDIEKRQEFKEMNIEHKSVNDDVGDLAAWYVHYANETIETDTRIFKKKLAEKLEKHGYIDGDDLAETMKDYLCSPSSRFDNPDPVKFLADIRNSRFTGEENLANMSTQSLQKIMRGDVLKELGVSICFMLRFALSIPKDRSVEFKPISHTSIAPMGNEEQLNFVDINTHLPGVVIPQIDQDIDPTGRDILFFKKIMMLYTELPFEDDPIYFDTKEEYLAFYRWELENTVEDDWFFPTWLLHGEKGEALADLVANKMKHSQDHLRLENPQDDLTMSDRVFYGTGQKYLSPIKLPGIHEDHDYFFPLRARDMLTGYHRDKFKYAKKPSMNDLLRMVRNFHADRVNETTTMLDWKDKILQLDFAVMGTLPSRPGAFYSPGAILYIDVESRMPMGIYESPRERMFWPNEGRDWTHAKYFWRVAERAALAGAHVMESHFGWSNPVSTAAWQTLPHDHGLRVLLKPFTLNVHSVNNAAWNMLTRDDSVLTHGAGVVTGGVNAVFHLVYNQLNFSQTVPEALDAHGLDGIINTTEMPLFSQGRQLYYAHREFVDSFISTIYESDEALLKDSAVVRFWHHTNTFGRHLDPCVCQMDSDLFFDDDGQWPQNEHTRTCKELMDLDGFHPEKNLITRRRHWCEQEPFERIKVLRSLIETTCKAKNKDCKILYELHFMRSDMGLKPLRSRSQLVDFIATFIWEVTAGHEVNGDNISFFADPEHSGVRMREFDKNGELPITTDVGTYVFGTSIATLTTIRSPPLLADWSPLYAYYASTKKTLPDKERRDLLDKLNGIHKKYKYKLFDLSVAFLKESLTRRINQRSNVFIPAVQLSSVSA